MVLGSVQLRRCCQACLSSGEACAHRTGRRSAGKGWRVTHSGPSPRRAGACAGKGQAGLTPCPVQSRAVRAGSRADFTVFLCFSWVEFLVCALKCSGECSVPKKADRTPWAGPCAASGLSYLRACCRAGGPGLRVPFLSVAAPGWSPLAHEPAAHPISRRQIWACPAAP